MWYSLVFVLGGVCGYFLGSKELDVNFKFDLRVILGCLLVAGAYTYCIVKPLSWLIYDQSDVYTEHRILGSLDTKAFTRPPLRKSSSLTFEIKNPS